MRRCRCCLVALDLFLSRPCAGFAVRLEEAQTDSPYRSVHVAQVVRPSSHRRNVRQQQTANYLRPVEPNLEGRVHSRGSVQVV